MCNTLKELGISPNESVGQEHMATYSWRVMELYHSQVVEKKSLLEGNKFFVGLKVADMVQLKISRTKKLKEEIDHWQEGFCRSIGYWVADLVGSALKAVGWEVGESKGNP